MITWISVKSKLPESKPNTWSKPVIALSDTGEIFELSIMGDYWQRSEKFISSGSKEITHWIPYPEFPSE